MGDNIKIWICRQGWIIMNPTQSESIWKRINQEEQAKFRRPDDDVVNNSLQPIPPRPLPKAETSRKYRRGKPSPASPQELQKQSNMKQVRAIFQWDQQFEEKLHLLHFQLGNKWSAITSLLKGPENLKENDVKNKVYSTMRRGFRKVNKFIANVKRRRNFKGSASHKLLKEEFIVKLNAVADYSYEDRFEVKQSALSLSRELRRKLMILAKSNNQYQENQDEDYSLQESLLSQILTFNKNCKKRKGKRKGGKHDTKDEESEEEDKYVIEIHSETPIQSIQSESTIKEIKEQMQQEEQDTNKPIGRDNFDDNRNGQMQRRGFQESWPAFELHSRIFRQQHNEGNNEGSSLEDTFLRGSFQHYLQSMKESINTPYPSINPTPTDSKFRSFNQDMLKHFMTELSVSRSSFTPSFFVSSQEGERTIKFIESIPNLTADTQALVNSSQIRSEMQDSTNISQKLKRSSHSQSACLQQKIQELKISVPTYLPSSSKSSQHKQKQ